MYNHTVIGIDLAKNSFHVCVVDKHGKVVTDRAFTKSKLEVWLAQQLPALVAMEACGSAHYWARKMLAMGHTPMLLTTKAVSPYRQGQKTDKNDALAIAITACQPRIKTVSVKSVEQQGFQAIERMREHWLDHITATSNLIRGLLYEFGISFPKGFAALKRAIPELLEDAENGLPGAFRLQLAELYRAFVRHQNELSKVNKSLDALIRQQSDCQRLLELEGVGPVNALGIFLALGDKGESFKNGREASACIGVTPKQYSTGGVVTLGHIGKRSGNKRLRSTLIQGALSVVVSVDKRASSNTKEAWLKSLIERRGKLRAAVALANKTIRTAWAMLHYNTAYQTPKALTA